MKRLIRYIWFAGLSGLSHCARHADSQTSHEDTFLPCVANVLAQQQQCSTFSLAMQAQCTSNARLVQQQCNSTAEQTLQRCSSAGEAFQQRCDVATKFHCDLHDAILRQRCRAAATSMLTQCATIAGVMHLQCSSAASTMHLKCNSIADVTMQRQCGTSFIITPTNTTTSYSFGTTREDHQMTNVEHKEREFKSVERSIAKQALESESTQQGTLLGKHGSSVTIEPAGDFNPHDSNDSLDDGGGSLQTLVVRVGIFHTLGAAIYAFISAMVMIARIRAELPTQWKVLLELPSSTPVDNLFTRKSLHAMAQAIGVQLKLGGSVKENPGVMNWDLCLGRTLHLKRRYSRDGSATHTLWRRELNDIVEMGEVDYNSPAPCVCDNRTVRCAEGPKQGDFLEWSGDPFELPKCLTVEKNLLQHYLRRAPSWIYEIAAQERRGYIVLLTNMISSRGSPLLHHAVFERELAAKILAVLEVKPPQHAETVWPWEVFRCAYYFKRGVNTRSPGNMIALMQKFITTRGLSCVYVNSLDNPVEWNESSLPDLQVAHANKEKWTNQHQLFFATISPLLIIDQSSHWGDHILFQRSLKNMPSIILPWAGQKHGPLECDSGKCRHCIFRRGWCFDAPTVLLMENAWDGCKQVDVAYSQANKPLHTVDWPGDILVKAPKKHAM